MLKKITAILMSVVILLSLVSCFESPEDKMIKSAQEPVDRYMEAFCRLDLKGMAEATDAQIDYSDLAFLSLDELKSRLLVPFSIFEALGVPMDEFNDIVDEVFAAYEQHSSYSIVDSQIQGNDVVFTINVEYVSLSDMSEIIDTAIERIDYEALEDQIAAGIIAGGLKMAFGNGSATDVIMTAAAPVIEQVKVEIRRSIDELTPYQGTITLVATQVNNEWIVSDSMSDAEFLAGVF